MKRIEIETKSDFDGYFTSLTKQIVALVNNPRYSKVVVTAGPYRAYGMAISRIDDDTAGIDFYSALRAGFGSLTQQDLVDAAAMLEAKP